MFVLYKNRPVFDRHSGVDFDDPEYGFKEEAKSFQKVPSTGRLKLIDHPVDRILRL